MKAEATRIVLSYRFRSGADGDWENIEESISLETSRCNFGGERVWICCPLAGCGRRVATLYLGHKYFGCRHCWRLAYVSTREVSYDLASRRADKLRDRLGWEPGILNGPGGKPKWMRWQTFERLSSEHNFHVSRSLAAIARRFGGMGLDI